MADDDLNWWFRPPRSGVASGGGSLPPAMPGATPRMPPPVTPPLETVTGTPAFQLGYPLLAGVISGLFPNRGGRAIAGLSAGLNTANYYNQLQRQEREMQKQEGEKKFLGDRLLEHLGAEKFATPKQLPLETTFTTPTEAATEQGSLPVSETMLAAPTNKVPLIPDSPNKSLAQALIAGGQPVAALKFIGDTKQEHPHYATVNNRLYSHTQGATEATPLTPELPAPMTRTGDQVKVQAAQTLFPNDPVKQAEHIQKLSDRPLGVQNRVFSGFMEQEGGDFDRAMARYDEWRKNQSQLTATGTETGRLGVRSSQPFQATEFATGQSRGAGTASGRLQVESSPQALQTAERTARSTAEGRTAGSPLEASTQSAVAGLEGAIRQAGNIKSNLSQEFLGPVRGTDFAFSTRRQLGNYMNSPVGEKEVIFRQSLNDVADQLLRARSGAQINEAEYARLKAMLPKATDELPVFKAGLGRFERELNDMLKSKQKLGTTPRGQLGTGGGRSGIPKIISIEEIP